jgi:hypothetical protein
VTTWIVKAWWGSPRGRSQHSTSMVLAEIEVQAPTRAAAKAEARRQWSADGRFSIDTHLTASPKRTKAPPTHQGAPGPKEVLP